MRKQEGNKELIKTSAGKRSVVLGLLGVPMMYITSLSGKHMIFAVFGAIYVLALFINGISVLPVLKKVLRKTK